MKREYKYLIGGALGVVALAGVAVAGGYVANTMDTKPTQQARVVHNNGAQYARMAPAAQAPAPQPCDDNNIVGTLGGGIAGGVLGAQFGNGNGRTAATAAGALGGAALGNKFIPTRGATCN